MSELLREIGPPVRAGDGTLYLARVYGAPRGKLWIEPIYLEGALKRALLRADDSAA